MKKYKAKLVAWLWWGIDIVVQMKTIRSIIALAAQNNL